MSIADLLFAQLADPFRIGLVVALFFTSLNTASQVGYTVPLALGAVFVAVMIPTAFGAGEAGMAMAVGVGLVANAILLGVLLAAKAIWDRLASR